MGNEQMVSAATGRRPPHANQIATVEDLQNLKQELIAEIRKLLKEPGGQPGKKWLKTGEVQKLMGASPGTLQRLRNNGTLPHKKIGGVVYYDQQEINKLLEPDTKASSKRK